MVSAKKRQSLGEKLLEALEPHLPGIEVEVDRSQRWQRMTVTFRHRKFAALLPEQRFRTVLQLLPAELYEKDLRGAVWFELAPGETPEDVTQARRSQDVAEAEPRIADRLRKVAFFEALSRALGESPIEACTGDFAVSRRVLSDNGIVGEQQRDACLVFIRQGAYCDCEVLLTAGPALTRLYDTPE